MSFIYQGSGVDEHDFRRVRWTDAANPQPPITHIAPGADLSAKEGHLSSTENLHEYRGEEDFATELQGEEKLA